MNNSCINTAGHRPAHMCKLLAAAAFLILAGCSRGDSGAPGVTAGEPQAQAGKQTTSWMMPEATQQAPLVRRTSSFANLPDRGELISYTPAADVGSAGSKGSRQSYVQGAYTWNRVAISEDHALRAIAEGKMRLATPSGEMLDVIYDKHVEHPSGDLSWIGHVEGHPEAQTIMTFGADAVYGSIAQVDKRELRLTTQAGESWLIETDPAKLVGIKNLGANPESSDHLPVPANRPQAVAAAAAAAEKMSSVVSPNVLERITAQAAAATTPVTIDLLIGYTKGYTTSKGSASAVTTRLNQLVTVANEAFANSTVKASLRLVHSMEVDYSDTTTNSIALGALTGYDSDAKKYTTPNTAFSALRKARETYGADLVALVRPFRDPQQEGCGVAWLNGGGQSGVEANDGSDYFGYSVVSDGQSGSGSSIYYCRDESLVHELGHNMGSAHDRETAKGEDGKLDAGDYGAFSYSFGYKTSATAGNFHTVMAYGDNGQTSYRVFSNPRVSAPCGNRACGTTANEDNARSLDALAPIIATFRASKYVGEDTSLNVAVSAGDYNGDGQDDMLWRNKAVGNNVIWRSANFSSQSSVTTVDDVNWRVAGAGDFNRDGRSDVVWRHGVTGKNAIWLSANSSIQQSLAAVVDANWRIAATGDFNGDGRSDLVWRHLTKGSNAIWLSGSLSAQQEITDVPDASWEIAGAGDFDGDGYSDVVWRNRVSGANTVWLAGASNDQSAIAPVADIEWRIVGIGDFNGDGRSDLVWRHSGNGRNTIWLSGDSANQQSVQTVTDTNWQIASIGDFNGDGRSDLLWRHVGTGEDVIWKSANSKTQTTVTAVTDLAWLVVG